MAENSKIEWTHHTANLWWGCQKVHAGCDNCYAENLDKRWGGDHWGPHTTRRAIKGVFSDLLSYQRKAAAAGEVHRVFVGSMMDIFEKPMPLVDIKGNFILNDDRSNMDTGQLRDQLFEKVSLDYYPNLLFLLLTKRPGNIMKYIPNEWKGNPPMNVMYGTSPVNQETADDMIPKLLAVPGKHFLSCEPLLGPINLKSQLIRFDSGTLKYPAIGYSSAFNHQIDWAIVGGESGQHARPMHPGWARDLRDQCEAAGVPFFFKQWGEYAFNPNYTSYPGSKEQQFIKVGKKDAGRLLDGKQHSQFPVPIMNEIL